MTEKTIDKITTLVDAMQYILENDKKEFQNKVQETFDEINDVKTDEEVVEDSTPIIENRMFQNVNTDNIILQHREIDTLDTNVVIGTLANKIIKLDDLTVSMDNIFGSVIVQSFDDKPIRSSGKILISINEIPLVKNPEEKKALLNGYIRLNARPGLSLFGITSNGIYKELPFVFTEALETTTYTIKFENTDILYYMLRDTDEKGYYVDET